MSSRLIDTLNARYDRKQTRKEKPTTTTTCRHTQHPTLFLSLFAWKTIEKFIIKIKRKQVQDIEKEGTKKLPEYTHMQACTCSDHKCMSPLKTQPEKETPFSFSTKNRNNYKHNNNAERIQLAPFYFTQQKELHEQTVHSKEKERKLTK